jgi:YggT family protein
MSTLITLVNLVIEIMIVLVIVHALLSYFVPANQPVRVFINKIVEPLLKPIRRYLPQNGMADFSPMILVLILIVIQYILVAILRSF